MTIRKFIILVLACVTASLFAGIAYSESETPGDGRIDRIELATTGPAGAPVGRRSRSANNDSSTEAIEYAIAREINSEFTSHIIGLTGILLAVLFGFAGIFGYGVYRLLRRRLEKDINKKSKEVEDHLRVQIQSWMDHTRKIAQVRIYNTLSFQYYEQYYSLARMLKTYKRGSDARRIADDEFERNLSMSLRLSKAATQVAQSLDVDKAHRWVSMAESAYSYHLSCAHLWSGETRIKDEDRSEALKLANNAYSHCRDPNNSELYDGYKHHYADTYGWVLTIFGDEYDKLMAEQLLRSLLVDENLEESWRQGRKKAYQEHLKFSFDQEETGSP